MTFDLSTWKQSAGEKLHRIGSWLDRRKQQDAPYLVYGTLCGLSLWPLVEAARAGQFLPVMMALGSVAGSAGGNLIAEQVQRWKDQADADEAEVNAWVQEHAPADPNLRAALDAILEQLDAVTQAQSGFKEADRQRFADTLKSELAQLGNLARYEATLIGSGAIAQGAGPVAAGERGVAVGGNVTGNIIAGDQNRVVQAETYIEKQEVHSPTPPDPVQRAREHYLTRLRQQCNVLPLGTLGGEQDTGQDVSLEQVYVDLDTQTRVPLTEEEKAKREGPLPGREQERLLSALEAATQNHRLVLLGDPGSGKSTFVRQLTAWLAAACLGKRGPLPDWDPCLLPMLTTLRDLSPRLGALKLDGLSDKEQQCRLVEAMQQQWHADLGELGAHDLAPGLEEALTDGKVALVLDGLDEVPAGLRGRVRQAVHAVLSCYPAVQRVIVTCRIRSYAGAAVLREFAAHTLASFNEDKISQFVAAWYEAQSDLGRMSDEQAKSRAQDLQQAARTRDLLPLSSNPMLLTTMAIIHQREVGLPRERVRLYAQAVQVLISRWQKRKGLVVSDALGQVLSSDLALRSILERLGYEAHRIQSAQGNEADLARKDILALLEAPEYLGEVGVASEFLDYCDQRAGLLIGRGGEEGKPRTYTFAHRTFQEYLAGCYMVKGRTREIAAEYLMRVKEGDYWMLASRLGAEELLYNKTKPEDVLDLAYALCPTRAPAQEPDWRAVLWSGQAAALLGREQVTRDADKPLGDAAYLERLLPRLVEIVQQERLDAVERAEAGRALGRLGDPRPEVMSLDHMEFCFVPRGPFWMGSKDAPGVSDYEKPQHQVNVANDYWVARHPVTNAHFAAFVEAGGYREPRYWREAEKAEAWQDGLARRWWYESSGGEVKRVEETSAAPHDFGEPFNLPNHPVVGVTWYEALAFTRWLTDHWRKQGLLLDSRQVCLPSEAQWEKAARGGVQISNIKCQISDLKGEMEKQIKQQKNPNPKRVYPWGDEPDANRMNYAETRIETTSAVGCFPGGASLYGCEDMSGNVWEWCATKWQDSYKDYKGDNDPNGSDARVLRGGAFSFNEYYVRCAFRFGYFPDFRDSDLGFRVVLSPL
jgi:formylglycine-generating enzyme required for sulfatase activity